MSSQPYTPFRGQIGQSYFNESIVKYVKNPINQLNLAWSVISVAYIGAIFIGLFLIMLLGVFLILSPNGDKRKIVIMGYVGIAMLLFGLMGTYFNFNAVVKTINNDVSRNKQSLFVPDDFDSALQSEALLTDENINNAKEDIKSRLSQGTFGDDNEEEFDFGQRRITNGSGRESRFGRGSGRSSGPGSAPGSGQSFGPGSGPSFGPGNGPFGPGSGPSFAPGNGPFGPGSGPFGPGSGQSFGPGNGQSFGPSNGMRRARFTNGPDVGYGSSNGQDGQEGFVNQNFGGRRDFAPRATVMGVDIRSEKPNQLIESIKNELMRLEMKSRSMPLDPNEISSLFSLRTKYSGEALDQINALIRQVTQ
jgi:hypothetical protein